jgi:hypothetical protein
MLPTGTARTLQRPAGSDETRPKKEDAMTTFQWGLAGGFSAMVMALAFFATFLVAAHAQSNAQAHAHA